MTVRSYEMDRLDRKSLFPVHFRKICVVSSPSSSGDLGMFFKTSFKKFDFVFLRLIIVLLYTSIFCMTIFIHVSIWVLWHHDITNTILIYENHISDFLFWQFVLIWRLIKIPYVLYFSTFNTIVFVFYTHPSIFTSKKITLLWVQQ